MPVTSRPPLGPRDLAISDLTAVHNDLARDKVELLVRHAQKKNEKAAIAAREKFSLLSTAGRGEANSAKGAVLIETAERVKKSDVTQPLSREAEIGLLVTPASVVSRGVAPSHSSSANTRGPSRPRSASRRRRPKVGIRDPLMQNPDLAARMTELRADKEKFHELAESIKERREAKRQIQTSRGSKIRQNRVWASTLTRDTLEEERRSRLQEAAGHRDRVLDTVNDRDLEMRLYRERLARGEGMAGGPTWRSSSATPRGETPRPHTSNGKSLKSVPSVLVGGKNEQEIATPAEEAAPANSAANGEQVVDEDDERHDIITEFPQIQ